MNRLDLTLPTTAENLALDEALLDKVDETGATLRLWEPNEWAVIVGRASRVDEEVNRSYCHRHSIPILRRCSGGASVTWAPGSLMYAVTLPSSTHPELADVERAHRFVLDKVQQAIASLGWIVELAGSSDLVWDGRKFSGNSLRCKHNGLLYHGTLLLNADLDQIAQSLKMPPRQPQYRRQRPHRDFLTNLPIEASALRSALADIWQADQSLEAWPRQLTKQLVLDRYGMDEWNFQR